MLSVTVQVTVVAPKPNETGASLVVEAIPQLSLVVGVPKLTPLALQTPASVETDTATGQVIVGASPSATVTICEQVAVLPLPSSANHVTVVVPTGYVDGALLVIVGAPPQPPTTVGVPKFTPLAAHKPASVVVFTSAGHVNVNAPPPVTVTI